MSEIKKICHFTSAHEALDDRIFLKECVSLRKAGYDVYIVAKGDDSIRDGVTINGCGFSKNKLQRLFFFAKHVYKIAKSLDCDVYHFHDPELLPYGIKLKKLGKKVIFDSHEDVPAQILDKEWIPSLFRKFISILYKRYETKAVKLFDGVVTATPHIAERFDGRANKIVIINNYPKLDDIIYQTKSFEEREQIVCYAGGINQMRGEAVMVAAMKNIKGRLILAGPHDNDNIESEVCANVEYIGKITRAEVNELYGKSRCGFVLYQPAANHFEAQPIKMFEYMAAGLPFIASDFPLWKNIVEENNCGICVNPRDTNAVSEACRFLLENPEKGQEMGRKGRELVMKKYNWNVEEEKLLEFYKNLEI